jgi:SAM-dependent methyltransferase
MQSTANSSNYQHLLSIINTESYRHSTHQEVKILDVGCGNGQLIAYLTKNLPCVQPNINWKVYGLDVVNHGVQKKGFMDETIENLSKNFSEIDWHERLTLMYDDEKWQYPDNFFDVIISNQVVEQVKNHILFFLEISITLTMNGYSAHLFPLSDVLWEWHIHLPLVHKVKNFDFLFDNIKFLSTLGLGTFHSQTKESGISLDDWTEKHTDYLHYFTNYISYQEILKMGKISNLRTSFRYTRELYQLYLDKKMKRTPKSIYTNHNSSFILEFLSIFFLKYVASVTLFLEKKQTFN